MNRSRWRARLAAAQVAALAATLLAMAQPAPARAADTVSCVAQTSVFGADAGGTIYRYPLNAPGSANSTWSAPVSGGTGWQAFGRVIGGPGGRLYGINANGLYRYRWTSSGWETTNGVGGQRISTSFTQYATAGFRNKITVDERGDFYLVDGEGRLRVYRYDEAAGKWLFSGRLLDTGWGRFDLVVAAGPGVLYARDATDGRLFRYRYEPDSQRWLEYHEALGTGWNAFSRGIFSAGGDTLFGIDNSGILSQYRFREDTRTWAILRRTVGSGWNVFSNVAAITDACKLTASHVPARPPVPVAQHAPAAVTQATSNNIELAHSDNIGRLLHGRMNPDNFSSLQLTAVSGSEGFSGVPALSETTQNLVRITARNINSDVWTRTQSAAGSPGWSGWADLGGRMASAPATVRLSNQREAMFAVDAGGALWARWQDPVHPDLLAWRKLGGSNLTGTPVAVPLADASALVVVADSAGTLRAARYAGGTLQAWQSLGGSGFTGTPAVVLLPGYRLRIFARNGAGRIVATERRVDGTFTGTWTPVGGSAVVPAGVPSALLSPVTGRIGVYVRGTDGYIHYAAETAQGSGTWGNWIPAQDAFETYATDPTAFSFVNANGPNVAYLARTPAGSLRLYTVQEPASWTAGANSARLNSGSVPSPVFRRHVLPPPPPVSD
ncbi:tachylectin-related carbohydrate-binding protein [Micromonospora peucetia]|uniref:tachylectin-related carbohydrate-binding protein n=1 Tax=Micromonospora peucetia TaxID=47871 RepID=UPI002258F6F1|nr:tachylectin-related carbohydrate-binding protein [Micromonospora peucetia]MCX4390198.1 tachylectin-related carbohydrate-binding protein [Micromonospora peucetia]